MKRILILFGSPHEEGCTARMLQYFLQCLPQKENVVNIFNAYREKVSPCIACRRCAVKEGCVIDDSFTRFDSLLRECDLLIVASPVYNLSFPSPLKAVIDRFQQYFEARFSLGMQPPVAKHRQAVLLAAAGSNADAGVKVMEKQLKTSFSVMNTEFRGTAMWIGTDEGEIGWKEAKSALERLSLAIFS